MRSTNIPHTFELHVLFDNYIYIFYSLFFMCKFFFIFWAKISIFFKTSKKSIIDFICLVYTFGQPQETLALWYLSLNPLVITLILFKLKGTNPQAYNWRSFLKIKYFLRGVCKVCFYDNVFEKWIWFTTLLLVLHSFHGQPPNTWKFFFNKISIFMKTIDFQSSNDVYLQRRVFDIIVLYLHHTIKSWIVYILFIKHQA